MSPTLRKDPPPPPNRLPEGALFAITHLNTVVMDLIKGVVGVTINDYGEARERLISACLVQRPCGQRAHLIKTVESLEAQIRRTEEAFAVHCVQCPQCHKAALDAAHIQTELCEGCGEVCAAGWCGKCHAPTKEQR